MCCYMELGACSVQAQEDADWDECMDANDACVTDCFGYNPFTYDPNDPYNPGDGTITLPYTYDPTYTYDPDTFVSPARGPFVQLVLGHRVKGQRARTEGEARLPTSAQAFTWIRAFEHSKLA